MERHKKIIHSNPKSHQQPTKVLENNCEITDTNLIANAFNRYFTNIGNQLSNKIPEAQKSPLDYLTTPQRDSFFIHPITPLEIENEIMSLKTNKSTGPFSIPISVLKLLKSVIATPLETIFNESILTGIVPERFKLAKVIPVFKKGMSTNLNNYRPISLLSIFNKLLEKLMFNRLIVFLNKNNILYNKQFGFRTGYSTDSAILCIVDKIQKAIEECQFSCGVFLDFSKAFDTVNHDILIMKLEHYGIRGIAKDWLASYLSNRNQFVFLNNVSSDQLTLSCGIPPKDRYWDHCCSCYMKMTSIVAQNF